MTTRLRQPSPEVRGQIHKEGLEMADKDVEFEPRGEDFDTTAQTDKDGVVTLSQDIQDEQKAQGYTPDVQPKIAATPVETPEFDPTKTQPTGNVAVAYAVNATPADVGAVEDKKAPAKDAK